MTTASVGDVKKLLNEHGFHTITLEHEDGISVQNGELYAYRLHGIIDAENELIENDGMNTVERMDQTEIESNSNNNVQPTAEAYPHSDEEAFEIDLHFIALDAYYIPLSKWEEACNANNFVESGKILFDCMFTDEECKTCSLSGKGINVTRKLDEQKLLAIGRKFGY
jgi:hypothetical protein